MEGSGGGGGGARGQGEEDSRLLSVGVSAVCLRCFNQGRVSAGRRSFLFSRTRDKETPAAPPALV